MYTVEYFIQKFEAIPEDQWCTGDLHRGSTKCANGHCGVSNSLIGDLDDNKEAFALASLLEPLGGSVVYLSKTFIYTAYINDGEHKDYKQPTPKQRILAALYDIKKMHDPTWIDITASLASHAPVPETSDMPVRVKVPSN